jgi:hypothetical protein
MRTRNIARRLGIYRATDKTYGEAVMGATDTTPVRTPDSTAWLEQLSAELIEHPDRPRQWVRPALISDRDLSTNGPSLLGAPSGPGRETFTGGEAA